MTPASASARTPKLLLIGYVLLFFAMLGLDQTTKWHAEKAYMVYSDPANSEIYQAGHSLVHAWGVSPGEAEQVALSPDTKGEPLQVTKNWVEFYVTYLRNHGAVWGVFSDLDPTVRLTLFYSVTVLAVFGVAYLFRQTPANHVAYRTALVFVLAGAIGNFIDRLMLKYVIDWIHFQWDVFGWAYSFPVFNVADISIDIGIGLMILDMLVMESRRKKEAEAQAKATMPVVATPPA
jgi:signal peptidase II